VGHIILRLPIFVKLAKNRWDFIGHQDENAIPEAAKTFRDLVVTTKPMIRIKKFPNPG
jgi:hypothetical protein